MALGWLVWGTRRQWPKSDCGDAAVIGFQLNKTLQKGEECGACQTLWPDIRTFGPMVMMLGYRARGRRFKTRRSHNSYA